MATQTPTFTGFPSGVSSGIYEQVFNMTLAGSYSAAFVSDSGSTAEALRRLLAGMGNGTAYFNIHTTTYSAGEIRGNLVEPGIFRNGFD